MSTLANKAAFSFISSAFDVTATGAAYSTPPAIGHRLGVLQAIKYKTARFAAANNSDAAITVTLKAGEGDVASLTLAPGAAASTEVDVYGISGAANLTISVNVDTVGTGTGQVQALLDIEQPVIVSGC
jgi:hypothetical protein